MAEDRADVDHDRLDALLQQRQRQPNHLHRAKKFTSITRRMPLGIRLLEQAHRADAGVVHQNVQPAEFRLGHVDGTLPGFGIGDVAHHDLGLLPQGVDPFDQLPQPVLAPGNDN